MVGLYLGRQPLNVLVAGRTTSSRPHKKKGTRSHLSRVSYLGKWNELPHPDDAVAQLISLDLGPLSLV